MELDISTVPVDSLYFSWISRVCEKNKVTKLLISDEQSEKFFTGFGTLTHHGQPTERNVRWTHYRGIELKIIK